MDQINIIDPIEDMETQKPQTFRFTFIFLYKSLEVDCKCLMINYMATAKEDNYNSD